MKKTILLLLLITSITSAQWQLRNNGLPHSFVNAVDAVDRNNAVAATGGIYITNNAGLQWRKISDEAIIDISMVNSTTIYAVTESKIIKTTDGGTTWANIFQNVANAGMFNYVKAFQNTIIVMADCRNNDPNTPAEIYKSTDAGATWVSKNSNYLIGATTWNRWCPVDFASEVKGFIAYKYPGTPQASFNGFATTNDGGVTWSNITFQNSPSGVFINVIKMYNSSFGVAFGTDFSGYSNIYITRDGGSNWEMRNIINGAVYGNSIAFVPNNPDHVFLSANNGLYYSANGGVNWTKQELSPIGYLNRIEDIVFVDADCGWMGTQGGDVYWTDNKGNPVVAGEKTKKIPVYYSLEQNYPNPFNPSTIIKYSLPEDSKVTLIVYDLLGREVKTLIETDVSSGTHSISWNGNNNSGQKVAAGIYFYSLSANKFLQTRKMILMK